MWPAEFQSRLQSWYQLRLSCADVAVEQALDLINQWWFRSPWTAYHLHWDDQSDWPDPWQLLSDNFYCDVARGLGMLYTITLLDRGDITSVSLVLTNDDRNLVLADQSKYILNWKADDIVNTNLAVDIQRQYTQQEVKQQYL